MLRKSNEKISLDKNFAYKILRKIFKIKDDYNTNNFFIKENAKLYATPLLAATVVVEASDVIFATDSVPAVLSISTDTFIVYSSNIFAIIGLRALYFLLSSLMDKFKFLKTGIAIILFFVGFKMITNHYWHIPVPLSLGIILMVLSVSIIVSTICNNNKIFK
jgi:tellurite resistance protein TerC